jgi:hypothetical protein
MIGYYQKTIGDCWESGRKFNVQRVEFPSSSEEDGQQSPSLYAVEKKQVEASGCADGNR